jgi:hypothetical protein
MNASSPLIRPGHDGTATGATHPPGLDASRANLANPLLPNFAVDFLQNGIDVDTNRGVGFLPITATPDVAGGNPFLGGGGPRAIQLAARVSF